MTFVRGGLFALAFILPVSIAVPASAASQARHYDCSKPGNANKTACKGTVSISAPKAPATAARTTTTSVTTKTTTRHYDCTKAGNKNKTECKSAAAQTSSGKSAGAVKTTTTTSATTTDCTKWYNKARAACRTTSSASPARTSVAPAPKPTIVNASNRGENANPSGATAQCKDGTYSHAAHHSGACSRHGGVAKWMN